MAVESSVMGARLSAPAAWHACVDKGAHGARHDMQYCRFNSRELRSMARYVASACLVTLMIHVRLGSY